MSDEKLEACLSQYNIVKTLYKNYDCVIVLLAQNILTGEKIVLKITNIAAVTSDQLNSALKEPVIHEPLLHQNISKLITWAQTPTRVCLFLEWIENDGYFESKMIAYNVPFNLKSDGGMPKLKNLCSQILEAFSYIHEQNVVHLDIKPENILVTKTGTEYKITLIDFNLSQKLVNDSVTVDYACGTFDFKAPEVLPGAVVTTAADVWSFGVFLYALCVGYFPRTLKWQHGQPIPFKERCWRKYKNTFIQDVIKGCLEINPSDRLTAKQALGFFLS